jgi:hypothetical protein
LSLPAGTYLVTATALVSADDNYLEEGLYMKCILAKNKQAAPDIYALTSTQVAEDGFSAPSVSNVMTAPLALTLVVTLTSQANLDLGCSSEDHQHLENISMIAVKAGTVHTQ